MDYKYIEQLLERYWEGETTLQEEAILRAFFSQEDVPAGLMKYKSLFDCGLQEETLDDDFDARILSSIGDPKDEYAKYRQQQVDTVNVLSPVQAENITDSMVTPKPEESSYIE